MARPSKYKPEFAKLARKACEILGATNAELAELLEVSLATIYNWKLEHKEFLDALNLGKEISDKRVEKSLYDRAMGYSHMETKVFCNNGEITTTDVMKHYPPSDVACIFWLKNRRPDDWRDKQEVVIHGTLTDKERLERMDGILIRALEREQTPEVTKH